MMLDLRQFEDFPAQTTVEAAPGEIQPFREDVLGIDSVQVRLTLQKSGEEYYCQGKVTAEVRLECARCLAEYATTLHGGTDFIVRSAASQATLRPGEYDDEEYVHFQGNDLRVDITDNVRQALVLATPMKPICKEDCKGLCPVCGVNRNDVDCDCDRDRIDDRWAGLQDLAGNG